MNALSKLFEVLHLSRGEMTLRKSHRRRRARRQGSALSCETLEPKQLLAADVAVQFSDIVVDTTDPVTVALEGTFEDTAVSNTVVKFETNAPLTDNDFYVELTSNTPLTNANFLSYVNSGAYDNSEFHRSVSDFVLQGGGFKHPTVSADQPGSNPVAIVTTGTVQNEPGNLNTRGTIAMAKLGGQPDSATSQFFFNLSENSFLDSDNGGYTQFGSVLGSGMTVVDTMGSALTYDAQTYYSNTAFSDLPLWNINQDNIVQPQDFVQIENADVVTESDLMTYQVSSSDAAKLTASFDGNGDLVLTPNASASGSVTVTVTATSKLDNTTASDTFSVTLGGQAGPTITPIESLGSTVLGKDATGKLYAGVQAISYEGQHLTETRFAAFTPLAVEDFGSNGGKEMLFENSDGSYSLWSMTSSWAYQSNIIIGAGDTSAINAALVKFGLAEPAPTLTAIESSGTVVLQSDSSGKAYAGTTPIRDQNGNHIAITEYAGFEIIAADIDTSYSDTNTVMLRRQSDGWMILWRMDVSWGRNLADSSTFYDGDSRYYDAETIFGVDANGDATVGTVLTSIESVGSVVLQRDSGGKAYAGTAPILDQNGKHIAITEYVGFEIVAVDVDTSYSDTNTVMLRRQSDGWMILWRMDVSWGRNLADSSTFYDGDSRYYDAETIFGVDANGDATVGTVLTSIESVGSVVLQRDSGGKAYAGTAPILDQNGKHIAITEYVGFEIVAVDVDTSYSDTNTVMLRRQSDGWMILWRMDVSWGRNLADSSTFYDGDSRYYDAETIFGVDANGDSTIGTVLTSIESAGSVVLQSDSGGKAYAGTAPILDQNGKHIAITEYVGFEIVAVDVDTSYSDTNTVMLRRQSDGWMILWRMDVSWGRNLADSSTFYDGDSRYYDAETIFGVDANGDATVGTAFTSIESAGSVVLQSDSGGKAYAGTAPILDQNGKHIAITEYVGFEIVAVDVDTSYSDTNTVMLRRQSDGWLILWRMDVSWRRNLADSSTFYDGQDGYFNAESVLEIDANGDSFVGSVTVVESGGSYTLNKDSDGKAYAGTTPIHDQNGKHIKTTEYTGFEIVAVDVDTSYNDTNTVMLRRQSDGWLILWRMDVSWRRNLADSSTFYDGDSRYYDAETIFGIDANQDAVVGNALSPIESAGSVVLQSGSGNKAYAGTTSIRDQNGKHIKTTEYSGYEIIAVDIDSSYSDTNTVMLRRQSDSLMILWRMDVSWRRNLADSSVFYDSDSRYYDAETIFGVDANGDGNIGLI